MPEAKHTLSQNQSLPLTKIMKLSLLFQVGKTPDRMRFKTAIKKLKADWRSIPSDKTVKMDINSIRRRLGEFSVSGATV